MSSLQEVELNKPWVNEYLAREIRRKFYLRYAAGVSKSFEDYESYRQQRETAKRLDRLAMEAYFRNNPTQESHWLPILAVEAAQTFHNCENCDRDFTKEQVKPCPSFTLEGTYKL